MKKNLFILIGGAALMYSCAFHKGNVSTGDSIDCPMVYIASGEASTSRIFGIGGLGKDALIVEAKKDLYSRFPYKKGIKLSNFSVDYKTTFVAFVSSTKVIVSAEVYDCNTATVGNSLNSDSSPKVAMVYGFRIGDSLLYNLKGFVPAKITKYIDDERIIIEFESKQGSKIQKEVFLKDVYKTTKDPENINFFGFNIGDTANATVYNSKTKTKTVKTCTIIGINSKNALVEYFKDDGSVRQIVVDKLLLTK